MSGAQKEWFWRHIGITGWEIWTVIGLAQKSQRLGPYY